MMCSNCEKYKLLLGFEEYIVSQMPTESEELEKIFKTYSQIADDNFKCDECGSKVVKGESYIEEDDEVFEIIFRYMANQ